METICVGRTCWQSKKSWKGFVKKIGFCEHPANSAPFHHRIMPSKVCLCCRSNHRRKRCLGHLSLRTAAAAAVVAAAAVQRQEHGYIVGCIPVLAPARLLRLRLQDHRATTCRHGFRWFNQPQPDFAMYVSFRVALFKIFVLISSLCHYIRLPYEEIYDSNSRLFDKFGLQR